MTPEPQKVVLFSGGRTSGFMLRQLLDRVQDFKQTHLTIFCNTGKEMPQTLDFVHDVETRWNVPVIWLEYDRIPASQVPPGVFPTPKRNQNLAKAAAKGETTHWFRQVNYSTADRNGRPFNTLLEWMTVLPNVVSRGCSMQLKIRTAMRYLFSIGLKEYSPIIGIRKDEDNRAIQILSNCDPFEHPKFPLIEWNKTESDVLSFWEQNDFDLHLQSFEGNCDLCFLKAKWKRIKMVKNYPSCVGWWKDWETKKVNSVDNGKFFRLGEPYAEIERLAMQEITHPPPIQMDMFCSKDKDIPCSCAERGFGSSDED